MSRIGLFLFLACGLLWGIPYIFIKIAVTDFTPSAIIFARTAIAAIILIPIAAKQGSLLPALRKWKTVIAFALFEMAGPWWLINSAESGHIDSGLAGLLIATTPFFALAIGYLFLNDKTLAKPKNFFGLILGFIGVGLLVGIDTLTAGLDPIWVLACVAASLGYAVAPAIATKTAPQVDSIGILSLSMVFTALIYAIPCFSNPLVAGVIEPKITSWIALLILGIVCSAVTFVLFFALIKEVSYSRSSLVTYLNTAVAILCGVLFGSEPFTIGMAVGLPLVAVGSYFATNHKPETLVVS